MLAAQAGHEVGRATLERAGGRGVEFKQVFLPRLELEGLRERQQRGEDAEMHAERVALLRRQLFVAMTRARDGLWIGWFGDPSSLLPRSLMDGSTGPAPLS